MFVLSVGGGTGGFLAKNAFQADSLNLGGSSVSKLMMQQSLVIGAGTGIAYGLASMGKQFGAVSRGTQDMRGAWANILTDTMLGSATALGGGVGGGLSAMGMRAIGATGLIGTAVSVIGGAVGGLMGHAIFTSTGTREKLLSAFGSKMTGAQPAA